MNPTERLARALYDYDYSEGVTLEDWEEVDAAYTEAAALMMVSANLMGAEDVKYHVIIDYPYDQPGQYGPFDTLEGAKLILGKEHGWVFEGKMVVDK